MCLTGEQCFQNKQFVVNVNKLTFYYASKCKVENTQTQIKWAYCKILNERVKSVTLNYVLQNQQTLRYHCVLSAQKKKNHSC